MGAALLWVPIKDSPSYLSIPRDQTNNALGPVQFDLATRGSSIGVAINDPAFAAARHAQFHQFYLGGAMSTPLNPTATGMLDTSQVMLLERFRRRLCATSKGFARIYGMVQQQAMAMSYLDMFRLFALASLAVIPFVLLMRRAVAKTAVATFAIDGCACQQGPFLYCRSQTAHGEVADLHERCQFADAEAVQ